MCIRDRTGILQKKTMWFIGVEVEQDTSAPPPKKKPGSAPVFDAQITKFCHSWCFVSRTLSARELHYDVIAQFTALVCQQLSATRANLRVSCGM